jgi:hypothetical protein
MQALLCATQRGFQQTWKIDCTWQSQRAFMNMPCHRGVDQRKERRVRGGAAASRANSEMPLSWCKELM